MFAVRSVLLVAALAVFCSAALVSAQVVDLTDATFDASTGTKDTVWLVKFYAPWCGHCKRLTPTWDALAESVKDNSALRVAKIDCTTNDEVCARFGVKGYPTLKAISGGKVFDYNGDRTETDLAAFLKKDFSAETGKPVPKKVDENKPAPTGPSDVFIATSDNFEKSILEDKSGSAWLVKFYAPWCGHCKRMIPAYEETATALKGQVRVAKVDCDAHNGVCRRFNVRGFPTLMLIKDGKVYKHSGDRSAESLQTFAKEGYSAVQGDEIPGPTPLVSKEDFLEVFKIVNKFASANVWLFVAAGFLCGMIFGALLFGGSSQPRPKPQVDTKKTQ